MKIQLIGLLVCMALLRGIAQKPTIVTKNFKFKDGVYTTFTDWQKNKPSMALDSLETNLAVNPKTMLMQVEFARHKKTHQNVVMDSVWGIVVDGIPYIKVSKSELNKKAYCFAGLVLRGRLCYFNYEAIKQTKVPITAYIPQTGEPYVTKKVPKEEIIMREKLMTFETGEVFDLSLSTFKHLIEDDKELVATVNDLKANELKEKLFKCVLIYNDRNPVYLK
ncbi:MAG: hypothetical protein JNL70_06660 [Saprospiraceae bacterium]|nr:hypothetical protein [Saprospiraceae bacterium]